MIFHSYVSLPEGILYVVNLKQDRKVFHDCNVLSFLLRLFLYIYIIMLKYGKFKEHQQMGMILKFVLST